MKKFKFSLEKVLEIKEIEEKIIQKNLLLIQNQIYETEKKITVTTEKISAERKNVSELSLKISNSIEIMLHYKFIESLIKEKDAFNEALCSLKLKEINIKKQLLDKSKETKALERLKEIKFEEFKKAYNKEQQIFIDEISIQNHRLKEGMFK
ncbi:MAG: flagellar FliJ family protein [Candidatus Cloacimonetes bacterium]|jgi:flagellar FliJ protein|nr:flagellar FliJ family protein [Candidatus Cloacimonadota bacterium]MDD4157657.1 flagellar FliJ family protein [Candidatus Cloacimonadota bacterium]